MLPLIPYGYIVDSQTNLWFDLPRVVHLPAQQTIGLQKDKVSYRSYRAAARAIFTLVRAFCPPEGDRILHRLVSDTIGRLFVWYSGRHVVNISGGVDSYSAVPPMGLVLSNTSGVIMIRRFIRMDRRL